MRIARLGLVAVAAATALLPTMVGVADAQVPYEATASHVCNTATGQWDVTASLSSNLGVSSEITDTTYSVDGGPDVAFDFTPNPMPADGVSSVTVSVPGDASAVEFTFFVVEVDSFDSVGEELSGSCAAVATTTTAPATTTTAPAVAPAAVPATPAFTG